MKKTLRKITIILIICLMLLPLASLKHTEAAVLTEESEDGILTFEGEDNPVKGQSEYVCYITVHNTRLNEGMAGFVFAMAYNVGDNSMNAIHPDEEIELEVETEGWTITSHSPAGDSTTNQTFYRRLSAVVEADDENIINRNAAQDVRIKCTIPLIPLEEYDSEWAISFHCATQERSDYDGNVTNDHENEGYGYSAQITVNDIEEISINQGYEEKVTIDTNKNIFAKLDGNSETETNTYWSDFLDTIYGLEGVVSYSIKDFSGTVDRWTSDEHNTNIAATSKLIIKYVGDIETTYNLYVLGDIKLDTNYQIDINDVIYLRQAIVGLLKLETTEDFCLETTDVNNSNSTEEGRKLGDIGDVILLRKRIINCKWD